MTSQLDERPAQILTPSPNRNESRSRSRTWMVATAVVAALALGAGLIVGMALTDGARSPADEPEQADASALEVNRGVLPAHLQEFEARFAAGSTDRGVLPAHLQEFEARFAAGSTDRGES
jgi:hypothetical protein